MSGLGWKLRRLGAMRPGEIAHRTRIALRDAVAPPSYARLTPAEAAERLFQGPARPDAALAAAVARFDRGIPGIEPALEEARGLLEGRWTLFGREVRLDDPPRWRRHPGGDAEWPDAPSHEIDYRDTGVAGCPKPTWELGRLTFLPTLALAARATGDRAYARRALQWLGDWTAKNPLGHGIHHASGIEMALRVITTTWTLGLLGPEHADAPEVGPAVGLVAQQALHCRDHLSLGSSANNHLIAEFAAMTVAGSLYPSLRGADALARRGLDGLERETLFQLLPDGVTAEQAFGYLPFVWELLLAGFVAAEASGLQVSPATRERVRDSLEFARTIRLPGGRWPQIGDEDDGRVLLASEGWSRLDLVGNAVAAWLNAPGLADEPQALARLMCGRPASTAHVKPDGTFEFPYGGYTVWRNGGLLVTFDHGPLGLGEIAAHGHADALSMTCHVNGVPVILDPGTYCYQADPQSRDRFRGTPWHSTVSFWSHSQSEMRGPFLWGRRAAIERAEEGWLCAWVSGEAHVRRVSLGAEKLFVHDRVHGTGAVVHFTLAPGAEVTLDGTRAYVHHEGITAVFQGEGIATWSLEPGEYSPRFAHRLPTRRLAAAITGEHCRTTIQIVRGRVLG